MTITIYPKNLTTQNPLVRIEKDAAYLHKFVDGEGVVLRAKIATISHHSQQWPWPASWTSMTISPALLERFFPELEYEVAG